MKNFSNFEPPETIEVNGGFYNIETDYRVWIEVSQKLLEIDLADNSEATANYNLQIIIDIFTAIFSEIPNEPFQDTLDAIGEFLKGYPKVSNGYSQTENEDGTKLYSFKHDINYILLAIRNQSGLDLSYRCKHFHWWLFMLEFQTLDSSHYISQIMARRAYKGDDKELIKLREQVALPKEYTRSEQSVIDALDDIFYNA